MKILWEIVNEYKVEYEEETDTLRIPKSIPVRYFMLLRKYYQPKQVLIGKELLWNEKN